MDFHHYTDYTFSEYILHLLGGFFSLYHMPRPTQLTFLKASNTVSLLYGKTLQEPS